MRRITRVLEILEFSTVKDGPYTVAAPEVDWPVVEWPVYAVAPGRPEEPFVSGREPVGQSVTVYAPLDGPRPGAKDRVKFDGETWQVDGDVRVWDRNPSVGITRNKGIVVVLKRWEG